MKKPFIVKSSLKTIVNSLTEPSSASGKSICLWYAKSCCVMLVGNHWPLTLMSNWICWYLEALNNILFSPMSEINLILLFQFLKAQTDWPSNNCCEFSVCFLCPDPLLVAAESLGSGGARIVLLILSSARLRETNINQWENRTEIKWPI